MHLSLLLLPYSQTIIRCREEYRARHDLHNYTSCLEAKKSYYMLTLVPPPSCAQKQAHANKTFRKWVKSLLESSQALVDGRNQASEIERDNKMRESEHSDLVRVSYRNPRPLLKTLLPNVLRFRLNAKISLWSGEERIGVCIYVGRGISHHWVTLFVITNMEEWLLL